MLCYEDVVIPEVRLVLLGLVLPSVQVDPPDPSLPAAQGLPGDPPDPETHHKTWVRNIKLQNAIRYCNFWFYFLQTKLKVNNASDEGMVYHGYRRICTL